MRHLMLLRHAKAEPAAGGQNDFRRTLANSGREDAARMGGYMAEHRFIPDRVLVSPAIRTQETWTLVSDRLGLRASVERAERLYEASAADILDLVRRKGEDGAALLVVGHNPGLAELANKLLVAGDVQARARLAGFPTAALAVFEFGAASWGEIAPGTGRLEAFLTPHHPKLSRG